MASHNFVFFTLTDARKSGFGFTTYGDKEGNIVYHANGKDKYGNPIKRRFNFSPSNRTLRIPSSQADVIKFLEEHPNCANSPNGTYIIDNGKRVQSGIYFKKIDKGADAKVAVDSMMESLEAQNYLQSLDKKELRDAAVNLMNVHDESPIHQMFELLQLAKNNPTAILNYKNSGDINQIRSLIRRAIKMNLIIDDKVALFLGDKRLGVDEDQAIKFFLSNEVLLNSLKEKVDGSSFTEQVEKEINEKDRPSTKSASSARRKSKTAGKE